MDTLSPEDRHKNMSHIRSKDTKPEKQIRSALFKAGFRYRICDKHYPGKPDLIFPRYFAVIFINGCFWHAHENCSYFVFPKSNQEFWKKKFIIMASIWKFYGKFFENRTESFNTIDGSSFSICCG